MSTRRRSADRKRPARAVRYSDASTTDKPRSSKKVINHRKSSASRSRPGSRHGPSKSRVRRNNIVKSIIGGTARYSPHTKSRIAKMDRRLREMEDEDSSDKLLQRIAELELRLSESESKSTTLELEVNTLRNGGDRTYSDLKDTVSNFEERIEKVGKTKSLLKKQVVLKTKETVVLSNALATLAATHEDRDMVKQILLDSGISEEQANDLAYNSNSTTDESVCDSEI